MHPGPANCGIWPLAQGNPFHRNPMHTPIAADVVVDGKMMRCAVVPERDRADPPAEPAGEFRLCRVVVELLQQGGALLDGHVLEPFGERSVDEQGFVARQRVGNDDRMFDLGIGGVGLSEFRGELVAAVAGFWAEHVGGGMDGG